MLIVCQLRGMDSTGVFAVPSDNTKPESFITKVVGTPIELFNHVPYERLSLWNKSAVVGHCRKATVGAVNRFTAHPFEYGSLTGVHNGTLRNWRQLPGDSLATDSMTLYSAMSRLGVRETIEQTDGAYALVWYDEEERTVHFLRNKERPLWWGMNEARTKMYFASEPWMITSVLARNGIKMADLTPDAETYTTVQPFPEDVMVRTQVGGKGKDALRFHDNVEIKGDVKKPISAANFPNRRPVGFVPQPWADNRRDVASTGNRASESNPPRLSPPEPTAKADASGTTARSGDNSTTPIETSTPRAGRQSKPLLTLVAGNKNGGSESSTSDSALDDRLDGCFDNEIIGNNGLVLTKPEFEQLVDPNCVWCQTPHTFEEIKDGHVLGNWIDDDQYICRTCLMVNKREGLC